MIFLNTETKLSYLYSLSSSHSFKMQEMMAHCGLSELLAHAKLPNGQFHPWSQEINT